MLEIRAIKENPQYVINRLKVKNVDAKEVVDAILKLDEVRRNTQSKHDDLQAELNVASKAIGALIQSGDRDGAEAKKQEVAKKKDGVKSLQNDLKAATDKLYDALVLLPNLPHESVPAGNTPDDNAIEYQVDDLPTLADDALPHWELAAKYDLIDFETGVKITGAGFPLYKGKGARLQRALVAFFLDRAGDEGYLEVNPPFMVNEDSAFGTGQLPDKEGQMYEVPIDGFYLIPTSEVPVTNIYRGSILSESDLPQKFTAFSACFRREAGSYGKDVRGLNRLHQFEKVEIVNFTRPENSYNVLKQMIDHVESLVKALGLPYRILKLCGGDMSFASALTYDFEVWSAAQKRWLEVSSVSNFESFQSNRMKIRYRSEDKGKPKLVHTLNGSALALPRIMAALLENNQTPAGIKVPEVLQKYCGFEMIGQV